MCIMSLCPLCASLRDETEGRPPLVPFRLWGLCTCTSQLRSFPANTDSYLTLIITGMRIKQLTRRQ